MHAQLLNCASRAICPSAPFRNFGAWLSLCPCTLCFTHPSAVVRVDCSDSQGPSDDEWLYLEDSSNNPLVYEMCLVAAEEATGSSSAPSCTSALPAAPDSRLRSAARRVPRQTSLSSQGACAPRGFRSQQPPSPPAFGAARVPALRAVTPGTLAGDAAVVAVVEEGWLTAGTLRGAVREEPPHPGLMELFQSFQVTPVAAWQLASACSGTLQVLSTGS